MMTLWGVGGGEGGELIGKDSQVTSPYIFYKSNIVFDTITDGGVIPNPALDKFFLLNQLLLGKHYVE